MAQKSQKAKPAVAVDEVVVPEAKVVERERPEPSVVRAKVAGFALIAVAGWTFVLAANKFHVTAPVVFVCLGWLALMFTVFNLWRTGAAAAAPSSEDEDWGRPIGARGELEKEKRTLLKGIKEAEFDAAMGKLSKADAESLIRDYRTRAIDVIKELDSLSAGSAMSVRDQIAREVRARVSLDAADKRAKKPEAPVPSADVDYVDDVDDESGNEAAMKAKVAAARAKLDGAGASVRHVIDPVGGETASAMRAEADAHDVAKPEAITAAHDDKAKAEADAIAAKVQKAAAEKVALAEAKLAAAQAVAEAAEAKAAAARAAAEAAEAKVAAAEASDDSKGDRA